jgi:hypothetical protein
MEQLTHSCADHLHRGLAQLTQTAGELLDRLIVLHGDDRREVQSFSDPDVADL